MRIGTFALKESRNRFFVTAEFCGVDVSAVSPDNGGMAKKRQGNAMSSLTQRQLADLVGVSYPTVNRVLNGCDTVRPKMRKRVLEAAHRLGYRKNLLARSLSTNRTFSIGMIVKNTPHSYWGDVLEAMERRARMADYHVIICHMESGEAGCAAEIDFLIERRVDGLIVAAECGPGEMNAFRAAMDAQIPLLLFNEYVPGLPAHYLGTDSRTGARKACEYLLGLGHERICFLAGGEGSYTGDARREGYRQAMAAAGKPEIILPGGWYEEQGLEAAKSILELSPRPTAVFAVNDPVAFGVYQGLRDAGIRIPTDMSLMGYAGMREGRLLYPPLTTVAQPMTKLGLRAIDIILELIDTSDRKPVFEELEDTLLIRESCAPPVLL